MISLSNSRLYWKKSEKFDEKTILNIAFFKWYNVIDQRYNQSQLELTLKVKTKLSLTRITFFKLTMFLRNSIKVPYFDCSSVTSIFPSSETSSRACFLLIELSVMTMSLSSLLPIERLRVDLKLKGEMKQTESLGLTL